MVAGDEEATSGPSSVDGDVLATTRHVGPPPPASLDVPSFVDRYVVEGVLGRGAMGVVLRARDPRLDREVALKLLHERSVDPTSEVAQRLRREGQALARLAHPNVVQVYDVGEHDERVFIAMELVRGRTLREWLSSKPSLPQVLEAFVQAGEGLEAAHAQGLIHRDFKPANVLCGDDGRVRVVDFGLVVPAGGVELDPTLGSRDDDPTDLRMTATGIVVGTPAYMGPEVQCGSPADARSDQFSFCVALFEALYGQRPYSGTTLKELLGQAARGDVTLPEGAQVPSRLRDAVLRGLRPLPADRWPSMHDLLEQLRPRPRRRPWPWVIGGLAVGGLAAAAWVATPDPRVDCEEMARSVREAWDDETRDRAHAAFRASELPFAEDSWQRVDADLQHGAQTLAEARLEACEAARDGSWSPAAVDRRLECLGRRRAALDGAIAVLEHADPDVVRNSLAVVSGLHAAESCRDDEQTNEAPPPELAEEIDQARAELARLDAMVNARQADRSVALGRELLPRVEALGYPPLIARTRYVFARALEEDGAYEDAAREMSEAWSLARSHGLDALAAEVSTQLVFVVGRQLHRPEEAERWVRHAHAAIERLADPSDAQTFLEATLGNYHLGRGEIDLSLEHFERAVSVYEEQLGPRHPRTMLARMNLGLAHRGAGDLPRAKELMERVVADRIEVLGPSHPGVADAYGNLAVIEQELGRYDVSIEQNRRALELIEASFGREHPSYGRLLMNLSNTEYLRGEVDEALRLQQQTLDLLERTRGPRDLVVGRTLMNMGAMYTELERYDEAGTALRRAREIIEDNHREGHPEVMMIVENIALLDHRRGRLEDALKGHEEVLAMLEAHDDHGRTRIEQVLQARAAVLRELDRLDEALADQRRAVEHLSTLDDAEHREAEARFELAGLLEHMGEHAQAREQVERALALAEGIEDAEELTESLRAWLAEHSAP